jgi:hypothetical protein
MCGIWLRSTSTWAKVRLMPSNADCVRQALDAVESGADALASVRDGRVVGGSLKGVDETRATRMSRSRGWRRSGLRSRHSQAPDPLKRDACFGSAQARHLYVKCAAVPAAGPRGKRTILASYAGICVVHIEATL